MFSVISLKRQTRSFFRFFVFFSYIIFFIFLQSALLNFFFSFNSASFENFYYRTSYFLQSPFLIFATLLFFWISEFSEQSEPISTDLNDSESVIWYNLHFHLKISQASWHFFFDSFSITTFVSFEDFTLILHFFF